MKYILIMLFLVCGAIANAQFTKATLTASGLTCSMCSKSIYEALVKVKSVENVKSNIRESSYTIFFKKDEVVDIDDLSKAVEGAGFSVAQLKLTTTLNNVAIKNDAHVTINGLNFHFVNVPDQTLNGEQTLTVIDKAFTTSKQFKKYATLTSMKCIMTGTMETDDHNTTPTRVYHVTI